MAKSDGAQAYPQNPGLPPSYASPMGYMFPGSGMQSMMPTPSLMEMLAGNSYGGTSRPSIRYNPDVIRGGNLSDVYGGVYGGGSKPLFPNPGFNFMTPISNPNILFGNQMGNTGPIRTSQIQRPGVDLSRGYMNAPLPFPGKK